MIGFTRRFFPILTASMLVFWLAACAGESQAEGESEHAAIESGEGGGEGGGEHQEGGEAREGGEHNEGGEAGEGGEHEGEHEGEHGGEAHDEEGEESGVYIAKADTWDVVRNGARLVLTFDPAASAFVGSVENTNPVRVCAVRVEVHLSTGTELGPTDRVDLDPGATTSVTLPTGGETFESFTTHPEMSPCGDS